MSLPSSRPSGEQVAAVDLLECDGPASEVGGAGEEIALQVAGGDTPQEALDAFLATSPWVIPRSGYEPIASAGDRHAYAFRAGGEVKAVVVVSPRFARLMGTAFAAEELRTCASAAHASRASSPEGFELWFTEADTAADVVTPGGVERWPRAFEPIGCA